MLGVEYLENFTICDVTLKSLKGKMTFESKSQECVIDSSLEEIEEEKEGGKESNPSTKESPEKSFTYSLKLKFHTNIFGTFKQTIIFDFGQRPLLSKVRYNNCNRKMLLIEISDCDC